MKLVINAANVHQGGGRTLLLDLLRAVERPAVALLDSRLSLPDTLPDVIRIIRVRPTIVARIKAEKMVRNLCNAEDVLLCFGNLPPLFGQRATTFVFLQNRYLTAPRALNGLPVLARWRTRVERLWLKSFLRDAVLLVQTSTVANEVRRHLGRAAIIVPFAPNLPSSGDKRPSEIDYVYVASGEGHKNHRRLVTAWKMLADSGHYPTLRLTLDGERDKELLSWIEDYAGKNRLKITNGPVKVEEISDLYAQAGALIFPSLFESFGLPLVEADRSGIDIVAAERDYVRDIVSPKEAFDPESCVSIARAVMRHRNIISEKHSIISAERFIERILEEI